MSIWVRALCTKSVGALTADDLRKGIADRLPVLSTYYGEPGAERALAQLRVENESGDGFGAYRVHYGDDPARSVRVERWAEREHVRAEIVALLQRLADCDEEEVEDVRDHLALVVESVALELEVPDVRGIGWPVAIAAAATVAARGGGLIQADGEGWMHPNGREVEQLLDGD
jgi:hypothetical protein